MDFTVKRACEQNDSKQSKKTKRSCSKLEVYCHEIKSCMIVKWACSKWACQKNGQIMKWASIGIIVKGMLVKWAWQ